MRINYESALLHSLSTLTLSFPRKSSSQHQFCTITQLAPPCHDNGLNYSSRCRCRFRRSFHPLHNIHRTTSSILLYALPQSLWPRPDNDYPCLPCFPCGPLPPWSTMSRPPPYTCPGCLHRASLQPQQRQLRLQALAESALQEGRCMRLPA